MRRKSKYLGPLLGLLILAGAFALLFPPAFSSTKAEEKPEAAPTAAETVLPVEVTPLKALVFTDRLKTQGNLEATRFAAVPAKLPGTLEAIYVREGDRVEAGKTRLFKTESLKLEKTLEMRRHELSVARYGLKEKEALLEQVEADLHKAKIDYRRFQRLKATGAVAADALEQQESRYLQVLASRKHALALIDLSAEQVRQAQAALAIAEKDLQDAVVLAPISGVISHRHQEPGEMGGTGDPVVDIEDPGSLEVSALLPADYYPLILEGKTEAAVKVHGLDLGRLPVAYKSPTINAQLRTFEIKCRLDNSEGRLAPGAMAAIEVVLKSRPGLGVPREALVTRQDREALFTVD